jgi:hypothetical protein
MFAKGLFETHIDFPILKHLVRNASIHFRSSVTTRAALPHLGECQTKSTSDIEIEALCPIYRSRIYCKLGPTSTKNTIFSPIKDVFCDYLSHITP